MKKIVIIVLLLSSTAYVFAQPSSDTVRNNGWRNDIDAMLVLMKQQHYVYKSKPLPAELITKANELKANLPNYSDERVGLELEKLMYYMHDGHSYMLPIAVKRAPNYYMPIQFYLFNDGAYIINADEPYKKLIGCRVTQINGVSVDKIVSDMNSYIHQDNAYTVKWFAPTMLRFRAVHETYGLPAASKDVTLNLVGRDGKPLVEKIEFVPLGDFRGIPKLVPSQLPGAPAAPLYLANIATNFWFERYPEKSTLYFQFNQVADMENEMLEAFGSSLDTALTGMKPKLFIIDVRNNNGGNGGLLQPLIDVIKKYEAGNKQAKIVVITGRNTFSAAQIFIALLNKETHALFAGEPSSSSPNFVGEEGNTIMLPWSGAIGNISNKYHEQIPGDTRKWIEPDLPVTLSSKDYFDNRDPVMEAIWKRYGK